MASNGRIKGITVEIGGDTQGLEKALSSINKNIKNTQAELKDVERLLKIDPTNTELLSQKQRLLATTIGETKEKLWAMKEAGEQANEALEKGEISQSQYDALQREIIATENTLKNLEEQADTVENSLQEMGSQAEFSEDAFKKLGEQVEDSADSFERLSQTGEKLKNIGAAVEGVGQKIMPVSNAVINLGTEAVRTAADFDSAMGKVSAVSGAAGDDLEKLSDKAREMGENTKFSASEAAEAMNYMAMAGWKTEDMLNGIAGVMNLAAASGEDLAVTSDILTDAMTAFGLKADGTTNGIANATHAADVMAAAMSNANTDVSLLGEGFKYCSPVAGALGFSIEETAEAIGLMSNMSLKGSMSGTAMRKVMTALAGEVELSGQKIGKMNIQTKDSNGNMKDLNQILKECRHAFSQMSESEQAANAQALVGTNAMSGFLALMNAAPEDIEKLRGSINDCDGTAERMAATMQDNLNGQITALKSKLSELAIAFGEILMPAVRAATKIVGRLIDWLNSLSPKMKTVVAVIGVVVAALGPVLIAAGKLIFCVGQVMTVLPKFSAAFKAVKTSLAAAKTAMMAFNTTLLANPVGLVIAAIVGVVLTLVAAFRHLWETNEEFRTKMTEIWEGIKEKIQEFTQGIVDRLNELGFDFKDFAEVVSAVWDTFCSLLAPVFEGVFSQIANILGAVLDIITGILDIFIGLFTGDWEQCWTGIKEVFGAVWEFIKKTFENWVKAFEGIVDVILDWIGTKWDECWTGIKDFFVSVWEDIKSTAEEIWNGIKEFFISIWNGVIDFFVSIWNGVIDFFVSIWNGIKDFLSSIWNGIKSAAQSIWGGIKDFFLSVWNGIKSAAQSVWNGIKDFLASAWNGIKSVAQSVWGGIKDFFSSTWEGMKTTVGTVWNNIKDSTVSAWNNIKTSVNSTAKGLGSSVANHISNLKNRIGSIWNEIRQSTAVTWNNIVSGVQAALGNLAPRIREGFREAIEFITSLPRKAIEWGKDFIMGLVEGIKQKINAVVEPIRKVANSIKEFLHFSRPDKGPLRDYETWMPDFMKGLADGIRNNQGLVTEAVNGLARDMSVQGSVSVNGSADAAGIDGMSEMLMIMKQYLPYLAENRDVVLDTGETIGAFGSKLNMELRRIDIREKGR